MRRDLLPISLLRSVTPHALRMYAEASGWKRQEGVNGSIALYFKQEAPLRPLMVVLDEQFDDYTDRVNDAVHLLAQFENRPPLEIINDLAIPPADILRLAVQSQEADSGTLPLDEGLHLLPQPKKERFEGAIIGLQAEAAELFNDGQGRVTIRTLIDGRSTRVRFLLKQSQYVQACDAHKDRRRVAITGVLHIDAKSRMLDLIVPEHFQVLTSEVNSNDEKGQ